MSKCQQCETEFEPKNGSWQKFCSKKCCDKHYYEHGRPAALCKECNEAFMPKRGDNVFCSRYCARQARAREQHRQIEAKRVAKRLRKLFSDLKQCEVCKTAFVAKRPSQVRCSQECWKIRSSLACKLCGGPPEPTNKYRSSYCAQCRDEIAKASRKRGRWARDRKRLQTNATAYYKSKELVVLLRGLVRRTHGQCKLCGQAVSKRINPNNDRALEFDHKIPLCQGGPDTIDNLQAICRRCNGLKATFTAPSVVIGEWMQHAPTACAMSITT